jgi:DNA-binding NarL/FixJ family response regulator
MRDRGSLDILSLPKASFRPKIGWEQIVLTDNRNERTKVVIVSLPGMFQNMLKETFTRRADVEVVGVANGGLSAIDLIRKQAPELVVIDSNIPRAEASELIHWIKSECTRICSLWLVETSQQINQAGTSGADVTLRSYSLPDKLDIVLRNLKEKISARNE